jgi:uncharacterized membrane protein YphA (DoxX/SURF4 family)
MRQVSVTADTKKRPSVAASIALWILQVLLALLFLLTGILNVAQVPGVTPVPPLPLPILFMRFIGVIELAGALGLILPALTRIGRRLTPLAALGLCLEMIGAMVVSLLGGSDAKALLSVIVGLLCVAVAYGVASGARSGLASAQRASQSHHAVAPSKPALPAARPRDARGEQ